MNIDTEKIDEAVLALLWLTLHNGNRAWKNIQWEAMNRLYEKDLIANPRNKAKSVVLTEEGLRLAEQKCRELFARTER